MLKRLIKKIKNMKIKIFLPYCSRIVKKDVRKIRYH